MKTNIFFKALSIFVALAAIAGCEKPDSNDDVKDPAENYTLIASPRTVNFSWSEPAPQTVSVVTNSPDGYKVSEAPEWFTVAVDGKTVTLTAQSNTGDARSHELVISAEGAESLTITVNQEAGGMAKNVVYNFTTHGPNLGENGPLNVAWPTQTFLSELTDAITAGEGWGKTGGHFGVSVNDEIVTDQTLPVFKDVYGKAFDENGAEVDWLYNIAFTDNDNGKYVGDGNGTQYKIYVDFKANTTGAARKATVKLYFDDTDVYTVVGTYNVNGEYVGITSKDPIYSFDVVQPAE